MKIALICTEKLPVPAIAGGAIQQYIDGILPYLSSKHDITVFSVEHPGLMPNEVKGNVEYIRVPGNSALEYIANVKRFIANDFDLIHIFNRPLWVNSISEVLPNTKISLSVHNEMFHPEKISPEKADFCINRVEFINTVSKFIANGIEKLYPIAGKKLRVVYSAADTDNYKAVWTKEGMENKAYLKRKYNLEGYKIILNVSRLSEKKGNHIIMKAARSIMGYRRDVALVIVGSKWYGSNKEDDYTRGLKQLSASLTGPIVFTGFLPPSEISKYYDMGDVFVCCSQWNEPLARVHYEAMAAGLPIITTNRGGNGEVIYGLNNGIVIEDYKNPDAFAYSISYLLDNPHTAAQMGREGRKLTEERFNWRRVSDDLLMSFSRVR